MPKPHDERTPEDYADAAEDALEAAKVLGGRGAIGDQDFLERMARSDDMADHDGETCGMCHNVILGAEVAREMIDAGEYEDVVNKWATETSRRWEQSKFFKLSQEEQAAGWDWIGRLPERCHDGMPHEGGLTHQSNQAAPAEAEAAFPDSKLFIRRFLLLLPHDLPGTIGSIAALMFLSNNLARAVCHVSTLVYFLDNHSSTVSSSFRSHL